MGRTCEVATCQNNESRRADESYFQFPTRVAICQQWVDFCGSVDLSRRYAEMGYDAVKKRKICSDHFMSSDYKKNEKNFVTLNLGAVPTLVHKIVGQKLTKRYYVQSRHCLFEIRIFESEESAEIDQAGAKGS